MNQLENLILYHNNISKYTWSPPELEFEGFKNYNIDGAPYGNSLGQESGQCYF